MKAYFSWVLRNRASMMVTITILTALSVWSVSRGVLANSLGDLFFGNSPAYARYIELIQEFGSDETFAIAYEEADPLSSDALDRLERIVETVEKHPDVQKISSLLDLDRIHSLDGFLQVDGYADAAREDPDQRLSLIKEITEDPLLKRTLLNDTATNAIVLIELRVNPKRSGEVISEVVHMTLDAFAANGYPDEKVHRAGFAVVLDEMLFQSLHALQTLFPFVVLVMLSTVVILFRTPLPVILSMGVSLLSALWSLGLACLANEGKLNIFHAIVPSIITVVAVSDVIHLWSAYLTELQQGHSKDEAILESATDVGRACLLTSATTFVGFLSISLIPTPVFRQLGWVLGIGVGVALLLAMTLVPIAASFGAVPSEKAQTMNNPVGALVTRIVNGCLWASTQYPRVIIAIFTLILCLCLAILPSLQIETNAFTRLDEDNRIRTDTAHIEKEFGGSLSLDVFITSDTPGRMLDVEVLNQLAVFEQRAEALPQVSPSTTFVDLIRRTHTTMGGEGPLPTSREAVAQELLLFEMGGGSSLDPILDFDRSSTRMSLRINEHRMRATHFLAEDLNQLGSEIMADDLKVEVSGVGPLTGAWLDEIVTGQRNGMLLSIVGICVLMMVGLRSIAVGLLSMIPNLLPLIVVATATGLIYGDIDSDTLVVLMMAIGIGVDDTIHFLMRFRIESARNESSTEAIRQTFRFAGRAIVMTTVILAAGYFPLFFSEYYSMSIMGSMLPLALVVAMIADLLLVPALAQVGWLRYSEDRDSA